MSGVKLTVIGAVLFLFALVMFQSTVAPPQPREVEQQVYTFYIPKDCNVDISRWTKGHQQFSSEMLEFLNMRRNIEACGGHVVKEARKN